MIRTVVLLLSFLFLAPCSPVWGADEQVIFALFPRGWPPLEMNADKAKGAAVDIFHQVMPDGVAKEVTPMPKARRALYSQEKPVYTRLEAVEWMPSGYDFWWSAPVLPLRSVLYSPSANPLDYSGPSSLEGKTIGCIRNYSYPTVEPLFAEEKAKRYDVNREIILLRMVKAGRVQAAVMDELTARWLIRKSEDLRPGDFHVATTPVDQVDLRFAFNKVEGWDRHLPEINSKISQLRQSGHLEEILARYR